MLLPVLAWVAPQLWHRRTVSVWWERARAEEQRVNNAAGLLVARGYGIEVGRPFPSLPLAPPPGEAGSPVRSVPPPPEAPWSLVGMGRATLVLVALGPPHEADLPAWQALLAQNRGSALLVCVEPPRPGRPPHPTTLGPGIRVVVLQRGLAEHLTLGGGRDAVFLVDRQGVLRGRFQAPPHGYDSPAYRPELARAFREL